MNTTELFDLWAPPEALWSRWAKPVLFAEMKGVPHTEATPESLPPSPLQPDFGTAVIVDLPGAEAVTTGLALFEAGFRPVPLFNGTRGPVIASASLVDNEPIVGWLAAGAAFLHRYELPADAPPAFLIDSRRRAAVTAAPGRYDNRWIVFPQDFPSANFLRSHGITRAILLQAQAHAPPQDDLSHVLRRWQEAGIELFGADTKNGAADPQPIQVRRPSRFRSLFYTAAALVGLRRNSAGGFGSVIPEPSSGAG